MTSVAQGKPTRSAPRTGRLSVRRRLRLNKPFGAARRRLAAPIAAATICAALPLSAMPALAATSRVTTVTMAVISSSNFDAAHAAILTAFHKLHPNINVDIEVTSYGDMQAKLTAEASAGDLPDLVEGVTPWLTPLIKGGYIVPLSPGLGSSKELQSEYFSQTISYFVYRGQVYGIPANYDLGATPEMMYNKEDFAEAGVNPSQNTWAGFVDALKKVTAYNKSHQMTRAGLEIYPSEWPYWEFYLYLEEYGGSLMNGDRTAFTIDTPAGQRALAVLKQLEDTDHVDSPSVGSPIASNGGQDLLDNVEATQYGAIWLWEGLHLSYPKYNMSNVGFLLQPLPPGAVRRSFLVTDTWGWVVTKDAKNLNAAMTVMKFFSNPQSELTWSLHAGEVPARKSLEPAAVKAQPLWAHYYPILKYGVSQGFIGNEPDVINILNNMVGTVIEGRGTIASALKSAQQALDSQLAPYL